MSTGEALFQAVLDDPEDDASRLVYADWLEEREDARGELLHLGCQLAGLSSYDPRQSEINQRIQQLMRDHLQEWFGHLPFLEGVSWHLDRGLVGEIAAENFRAFLTHADAIFAAAPVYSVRFNSIHLADFSELVACPHLARLSRLSFATEQRENTLGESEVRVLAACSHVSRLRQLSLSGNPIGPAGVRALAGSPNLGNLTSLDLGYGRIMPEGAEVLAASPLFTRLISLHLWNNQLGEVGLTSSNKTYPARSS